MATCKWRGRLRRIPLTAAAKVITLEAERQVISMRFEDIARCEIGTVLMQGQTRQLVVLVGRYAPPVSNISVDLLEGGGHMVGCLPERFELGYIAEGSLLREILTGRNAIVLEQTVGPTVKVHFLDDGKKGKCTLCEPVGKKWRLVFEFAPPPKGTVARQASQ